jgi:hypothetical protein
MTGRRIVPWRVAFACSALVLALSAAPAMAQDYWYGYWRHSPQWRAITYGIYELNNRIAFLEANPDIDEGYKGPLISGARRDIRRLHGTLRAARWEWPSPCCYGRRPIRIP